ncbi:MAG: glycosyltransferase family 39 protein [Planctomycetota bacterium]
MKRRSFSKLLAALRVHATPVLVLLGLWLAGVNQGFPHVDSGLYAGLSRHAYSGSIWDWWLLAGPDQDYFNKPPMAFWIHGAFFAVLVPLFGPEMWILRLPSLLLAMVALLAFTDTVRQVSGARVALIAGLAIATTIEFFRYTKAISLDMTLAAFVLVGLWAMIRSTSKRATVLAGVAFGAALLTKPMLALLPMGLFFIWLVWDKRRCGLKRAIAATVVAFAVAVPWHVAMIVSFPGAFLDEYFGSQAVARIATAKHGAEPWYYYPKEIAEFYWPWMVPMGLGFIVLLMGGFKRDRRAILLIAIFSLGWLLALSISTDKASRYAVQVYPFMGWLAALWLIRSAPVWIRRGGGRRIIGYLGPAGVMVGLALLVTDVRIHKPVPDEWLPLLDLAVVAPDAMQELEMYPKDPAAAGTIGWYTGRVPPAGSLSSDLVLITDEDQHLPEDAAVITTGRFQIVGSP